MLRSLAVVIGSYLLSVVLVIATDPLLSRIFPGDFVRGHIPSNNALMASTAFFVIVSILCAWVCARFAPNRPGRPLVLHSRRSYGNWLHHPQLEQRMAALVLALMAPHLAHQLLDRFDACR